MAWSVKVTEEYAAWFTALIKDDLASALLGGDKAGNWQRWYKENIPIAERLYLDYTTEAEE